MARKARQRISYVLPLANSAGGHRLGVNGLAVDSKGILYTAGRDGAICAWNLGVDISTPPVPSNAGEFVPRPLPPPSTFRSQIQAHTHWVNDIVLCDQNQALVSCSSDLTVKVWRPYASNTAETIGVHSDYVKCIAAPKDHSTWVASGGLDRKLKFWDLNRGGETLQIDVGDGGTNPKGSIYSLGINGGGIIASGGPEGVVRLWDPRSGEKVTKFVGHTDNVRAILVSDDGNLVLSASSDTTIKLWSVTAGRCVHTLSMHNDSVWSLHSSNPRLEVFHSSDRSGLVAKTDVRNVAEIEEGICLAVCQEKAGVSKVVASGDYLWTATSSSCISRWLDVDTDGGIGGGGTMGGRPRLLSSTSNRQRPPPGAYAAPVGPRKSVIPVNSLLRLSSSSSFSSNVRDPDAVTVYSVASGRHSSLPETLLDGDGGLAIPVYEEPDEKIEGQHGLIKHFLLNDRRKVLTVDTAGEVVMWDLLKCVPTKSFGKRQLEDVAAEVNTIDSIANWCQVDTRTGRLACVLEENYCFDAEMYADEAEVDEEIEFRDDQRINLGRWVLRYLFGSLIDREILRDEEYRQRIIKERQERDQFRRDNAPSQIVLPSPQLSVADAGGPQSPSASVQTPLAKPQAASHSLFPPPTPGMAIGLASPAPTLSFITTPSHIQDTNANGARPSIENQSGDYFSKPSAPSTAESAAATTEDGGAASPQAEKEKDEKEKQDQSFLGKWRSFGAKKLGRSASTDMGSKPALAVPPSSADDKDKLSEQAVVEEGLENPAATDLHDDTLAGVIRRIRVEYDQKLKDSPNEPLQSLITPSLPNETPVLKPPKNMTVIVQEESPDSGGVADLYRGNVSTLGQDADLLGKVIPAWLGELLLVNRTPFKETVKISFILVPWKDELPALPSETGSEGRNARLNANRMLRAKKILAYVQEHLQQPFMSSSHVPVREEGAEPLRPEEWLELLCHEQLVKPTMTLATIRSYVWKTGGDVMLYYRRKDAARNGDKEAKEKAKEEEGKNGVTEEGGEEAK